MAVAEQVKSLPRVFFLLGLLFYPQDGGHIPSYKEPEISLLCSQESNFCPYPEILESSQEPHLTF
jgi:hypothetical protein